MGGKSTTVKAPITVEDVLNSRMIGCPFRLLQCRIAAEIAPAGEFEKGARSKGTPRTRKVRC
jgi:hypothetical protein